MTKFDAFKARARRVGYAIHDAACDLGEVVVHVITSILVLIVRAASGSWRFVRENARKAMPSRAVRWTVLYVPGFTIGLLFALKTFGGMDDLFAYVMEAGTRSVPVLIGIAITYGVATGLGWNLDNDFRAELQEELRAYTDAPAGKWPLTPAQLGALLILAGEMLSVLSLLIVVLAALLVFQ